MTEQERVWLEWRLWLTAWCYATPSERAELLAMKARIEQAVGWYWSPPYRLDNPPHTV